MVLVSNLFSFLLSPLFWIIVLILLGVLSKKAPVKKKSLTIAFVLLLVFSNQYLFKRVLRSWELAPVQTEQLKARYDFGIVLTSDILYDTTEGYFDLGENALPVLKLVELYQQRKVKEILVSGHNQSLLGDTLANSIKLKQYLLASDVSKRRIVVESESRTLHQSAVNTKSILDSLQTQYSILLLVNALEAKRAYATFYNQRMEVDVYPVGHQALTQNTHILQVLIPQASALQAWHELIKEWFAYYAYAILGYL